MEPNEVKKKAEALRDRTVQFLRDVIAIPSTSCQECAVVERVAREMEDARFDKVWIDDWGNVIGRLGSGPVKVAFNSHLDTVGVGDPSAWPHDPFKGKLEGGIVYGRGASDNKAAIATMVQAGRMLRELGLEEKLTFEVVGVVQEEDCEGLGVRHYVEGAGKPDVLVLGECTEGDVYIGHRGRAEFRIDTRGVSCHASAPDRGVNAVYKMNPIIAGVEKLAPKLKDHDFLGKGTVAVTKIECETPALVAVPDRCTIYLDRRMTMGETPESSLAELEAIAKPHGGEVSLLQYDTPSHKGAVDPVPKAFRTWLLDRGHPAAQAGVAAGKAVLPREPKLGRWVFSTDGVYTMGVAGIPTIGFGPGEEKHAHSVQDQVRVDDLVNAVAFYSLYPSMYLKEARK